MGGSFIKDTFEMDTNLLNHFTQIFDYNQSPLCCCCCVGCIFLTTKKGHTFDISPTNEDAQNKTKQNKTKTRPS